MYVALICTGRQLSGDVRLIDSSGSTDTKIGRLEVYYNGQWGTVFGINDARVACRQLGFLGYIGYGVVRNALTVSASTLIWLDELGCFGSETRLDDCPHNSIGIHNCDRSDDVGLVCAINEDLRHVNSSGTTGLGPDVRLELFYNGQWGTVCDDSFSPNDARVACRQLGYDDYANYGRVGTLGFSQSSSTTRTWLDELRCLGNETKLINCPANTIGVEDCTHTQDVALFCILDGDLRLIDNSGRTGGSSGRLEVYYSGQWGTVCDDSFSPNDARVACRQLGFSTYTRYGAVRTLGFSQPSSTTRIWLDQLRCSGTESRLINCPANTIGVEDCTHSEDVALVCGAATSPSSPFSPSSTPTTSSNITSISTGVTIPIIVVVVILFIFLFCVFTNRRRRHVGRPATRAPIVANVKSTTVIIAKSTAPAAKAQDTAYPMQSKPQYSNQAPPQNMYPPQSAAPYTTGQQQPPAPYTTGQQPPAPYTTGQQQPPAPYSTGQQQPPAPYTTGQQPPAPYTTGQQQPPAPYSTGQQPPAPYSTGQQPAALYPAYPTGQPPPAPYLSAWGGAPPAYPG
ncbi:neurotrypsin-like [Halichondria panicea]|uniref:neurotrypsin-like n=1 Tax=Halichondria panicea TaxID=6063 RepID=UPI00312B421E